MKKETSFPIGGILLVLFITLKLCHVIDWSWWWVLAPLWGGLALLGCFLILFWFAWCICFALAFRPKKKEATHEE